MSAKMLRDNAYVSGWGRASSGIDKQHPELDLEGLRPLKESALSNVGYQTLALTPRFRGIMQPEATSIERAAQGGQGGQGPHPPTTNRSGPGTHATQFQIVGQGEVNVGEDGSSYYQINPSANRSLLHGRRAVNPIRIPLGQHASPYMIERPRPSSYKKGSVTMRERTRPPGPVVPHSMGQNKPTTARLTQTSNGRRLHQARPHARRQPPINKPHRVYPPPFMNAPTRVDFSTTPAASSPRARVGMEDDGCDVHTKRANVEKIKDFTVRATACKRAGRRRAEANAYYSMGVLYDNNKEYLKAIQCYQAFQQVLVSSEDKFAQALAHNSIGVALMNLGADYHQHAIQHHHQHRDLADIPGKFIAFTNLGLIYHEQGDTEQALTNHQHALRCAIRMSSQAGQSVAIGNLGLAALAKGDYSSARVCMERHLALSRELCDSAAESAALTILGELATKEGHFEEASQNFTEALRSAHATGNVRLANVSKVNIGVTLAQMSMEEKMQQMGEAMSARNS